MTIEPTCYMCAARETSREHVPPKCLFPEASELGRDLRRNLIAVPSCDDHNSKKSADDEFLRAVLLVAAFSTSNIAKHQFPGKFLRGVSRNRTAYSQFFTDLGTIASGTERVLRNDRNRFDRCVGHIARALFLHTFDTKWQLPIVVASPNYFSSIADDSVVPHLPTQAAIEATKVFLEQESIKGENPEVFTYRLRYDESTEMLALAGTFYEFFEIYCASSPTLANDFIA